MKGIFIGILLLGCAEVGPPVKKKSVWIQVFANRTAEPGIREALTKSLVYEMEKYGVRIEKGADYIVTGEIKDYRDEALLWTDNFTVTEKELFLSVDIVLKRRGQLLFEKNIAASLLYTPNRKEEERERLVKKISHRLARLLLKEME